MRRFLRGLEHESHTVEECSEENEAKLRNKNLIQCIKNCKKTKHIKDDVIRCLEQKADLNTTDEYGNTPLHLAVNYGLDVIVELLLNNNADVNAKDRYGWTPLHDAIKCGETNIVTLLLSKNADVDVINGNGDTPLHVAAWEGQESIVKVLLNKNANMNKIGACGRTPLHQAIINKQTCIVSLLLNKNAEVNTTDEHGNTPLHGAVNLSKKNIVKLLLNKNINVNTKGELGRTPLHNAVIYEKTKIILLLRIKNADVNATDERGNTPLHEAVYREKENIVKLLLNLNAHVDAREKQRRTPLHFAVFKGKINIVKLLLSEHADVNAEDEFGNTPLRAALSIGNEDIVKLLLNQHVNVNARREFLNSLLYRAVGHKLPDSVILLLSKRVDVNATYENGDTLLHMALYIRDEYIIKQFLKLHVNVNARGRFERTPLHLAVKYKMPDIVTLLLSKHADVNATDENGDTPLHLAARLRQEDIVELLLSITDDTQDTLGNTALQMTVNINAKNLSGNTPLHEAAHLVATDIAALLVRYGADTTLKNKIGDTPLFLSQLFSFEDDAEIVRLLQIAETEAQKHSNKVRSDDPDMSTCNNSYKIHKTINLKSIDDFGFSGQLYETKMISLFYLRMLNSKLLDHDLLLGVNISDIGDMDDICLRYRVRDQQRPVVLFIQGKHKKDPKSKLTNHDFWSDCDGFDLRKYFKSYLKIIEKFHLDSEDPMFQGDFEYIDCYFILYTPAQENLGKKKKTEDKVNKITHELINTSESIEPFQYSYDDSDIDYLMKAVDIHDSALDLTPVKYYTEHAKFFFSQLWIYSNQANESKIESIVKKEINKYYNDKGDANNVLLEQYSDAFFLIVHHNIQEWWRLRNEAPYLTRSNDLFKLAKLIFLADVLLIFCNAVNYLKNDVQLQFKNFLHFTTVTIEDLRIFFRELITIINSLKLNNSDVDLDTPRLNFLITNKRLKGEITLLDSDKSEHVRNLLNFISDVILDNDSKKNNKFMYAKRHGTSEVGGVLLKMKMSSLIFLRALNHAQIDHNTVLLRAKILGISMTDICLRFQLKDRQRPVMLFMQLIYKEDPEKRKLTAEMLWRDSANYSLFKYFSSFLKIKERFQKDNKDHIFEGRYQNADCNFFLCTSVEESFTQKKIYQPVSREIMHLINTGENTIAFQLHYDDVDRDCLVNVSAKHQLNKLGNVFLKSVLHEKYCPNLLSDKLIAKYHVVMAHEVLEPCEKQPFINLHRMWKFRPEFFDSNLEHLVTLKESFFKTMQLKCHNRSKNKLQSLNIKLPLVFGNLDMKFRNNENQTDRIKWVADKFMYLLELYKDTKIVEINDDNVGPDQMLQQGFIDINGGIGSAVGNLLIFDTDTKSLKFDLKNKSLPHNANLFLKELKHDKYNPVNEDLSVYRIKINVDSFPKSSFYDDEKDKRQARDFLSKFWIYPIQAKEDQIERIYKYEINKLVSENKIYYKNGNISDLISLLSLNDIQKWSLLSSESPYLTQKSELFERAELAYIYSLLQSVVNFMYVSGTHSIDIKVKQTSNEYKNYKKTGKLFNKISRKLLNILDPQHSDLPILSILSVTEDILSCKMSKLTLKIHSKMESVLLIFTAEFADYFQHRAFARAGFVHHGSGGEISRAEGKLMIYEQQLFDDIIFCNNKIF